MVQKIKNTKQNDKPMRMVLIQIIRIIRNSKNLGVQLLLWNMPSFLMRAIITTFSAATVNCRNWALQMQQGLQKAFGLSKGKWVDTENGRMYQFGDGTYVRNQQIVLSGSVNQRCFYFLMKMDT